MNRYPLRLSALAIGVAMIVGTYSLVKPPAPRVAAHPAPTGQPTTLTIDAVYQRVQQAISRPGLLYQATIRETSQQYGAHTTTTVQWVDAGHNVAREDVKSVDPNGPPVSQTTLLTPHGLYRRDPLLQVTTMSSRMVTCPGATLAVSVVLGFGDLGPCEGDLTPYARRSWTVRRGQYAGRPAIVLLRTDTWRNGRQQVTFTIRLSLDAHTFLPLARESGGQLSSGRVLQKPDRVLFAHRFITASSVSADFFDPAALGYVPPNPEVPLNESPPGFTVYWLGVHFAGAAGLPPLLLGKVEGPTEGPYSRFTLSYMPPDDPFGSAVVTLQEWPRANWVANANWVAKSGPCWHREDLALPHGRAQFFLGFAYAEPTKPCPRRPYTQYRAHVFLGQTVIYVTVPGDTSAGAVTSPYVTRAGLVALVRALQPRVPSGPVPTPTPTYAPPPVPTGQPTGMTVADVYRRVQQAISRPGLLYHATIHFTARLGQGRKIVTQVGPSLRQWVDAGHDVAREEQNGRATLLTAQRNYLRDRTINQPDGQVEIRGPSTCDGATVATSAVLGATFIGCPQPGTVVQRGRYAGRPAIVLVRGTATGTWLLYLDARTFLPLAGESTGLFSEVTPPQPLQERMDFTHAFIPVHAVPAHFFDPAAIGYVTPENQLNHVPRGFAVYWLGSDVAGVRGLPPLLLTKVDPGGAAGVGYLFILTYSRTDDRFGAPPVTLIEWPLARWWRLPQGSKPPYGPCWAHRDITTPRGRARILLGFENAPGPGSKSCPAPPYNRFNAIAYLGQTVVTVDAPEAQDGSRTITNPYNTRKGIEMVVRALQPRVPTHGTTGSNK